MKKVKVGIVGAGISGLLACKYALSKGFHPVVFESQPTTGGVWTTPLETTRIQSPKYMYQFSDFPWPESVSSEFPGHDQVLDYIRSYADHFDLVRHVSFNSNVVGIEYRGEEEEEEEEEMEGWGGGGNYGEPFGQQKAGKWELTVESGGASVVEVHEVDFVVLAIGRFSGDPKFPEFPPGKGPEVFRGEVIHSMDYAAMDFESARSFVKGKRVVVVGVQKSAVDVAMECSTANGADLPCTLVYRRDHWKLPMDLPWSIFAYLYFNRFAELLLHKPGQSWLSSLAADVLSPLRWVISRVVESYLKWKLPLKKLGMIPNHRFLEDLSGCVIATVPDNFFDRVQQGCINLTKSHDISFCRDGVLLDGSDSPLETDVVIFATGFKGDEKLRQIFRSPIYRQRIITSPDASVPLYRQIIHPKIPQLAVIGFSESLANLYTSEMRCRWLFEFLDGGFKLPSIKEMEQDVASWNTFLKRYSGHDDYRRSCIATLHICYNDQLCKDMGWNPRRKRGFFADLFTPYGPLDYASP